MCVVQDSVRRNSDWKLCQRRRGIHGFLRSKQLNGLNRTYFIRCQEFPQAVIAAREATGAFSEKVALMDKTA